MKVIEVFTTVIDEEGIPAKGIIDNPLKEEIEYIQNDIKNLSMEKGAIPILFEIRSSPVYWRLVDKYTTVLSSGEEVRVHLTDKGYYYVDQSNTPVSVPEEDVVKRVDHEKELNLKPR